MRQIIAAMLFSAVVHAQPYRGKIGIQVEDFNEGSRSRAFVDLGRVFRPWTTVSGTGTVSLDANGWPLSDASTVLFDIRPIPAWAPPIDDPQKFQPDWGGTYHLSFTGQATIGTSDPSVNVINQAWNSATNRTTADVNVPSGTGLLVLTFTNTKSGIRDMKFIRPGYPAETGRVFTNEFLDSLAPFSVLRFMGVTATNDADKNPYPAVTEWRNRHLITDATQQSTGGKIGTAWEYVIQLANESGKDIWINIPVSATEDYIRQLALLMKARLNPDLKIYIEHSNEVWNPIFPQYAWNSAAAKDEGLTNLMRHSKRLVTISNIFRDVFGPSSINSRIRPVLAWWTIRPNEYEGNLAWVQSTFGPPSQFFYAIAETHYFNDQKAPASADPQGVLAAMRADSDNGVATTKRLAGIASTYGLKLVVYEGGPDNGGGSTVNVGNRILANRDSGMKDLIIHDIRDNWFALGGDLYMYFTLSSAFSRYGNWGAVEDIMNLDTAKYKALLELIGGPPKTATIDSIRNAASGTEEIAPGGFISIYGANFTDSTATWDTSIFDGKTLPAALNGVRLRVGDQDASIAYAGPTQINAVVPAGIAPGTVAVDLYTANGHASRTVDAVDASPGFYGYTLDGTSYAWGVLLDGAYVAHVNAFGAGYSSRPAKAGDIVQLFVNALGGLGADFPSGVVLDAPYAIDKSKVAVTIDGLPATVGYAGVIAPGLYQVNITIPGVQHTGDVPIRLTIGSKSTQPDIKLTVAG